MATDTAMNATYEENDVDMTPSANLDTSARHTTYCLNCGEVVSGNYCSNCGQAADTCRFTSHSFMMHIGATVTRMSGNFFKTSWRLLTAPWDVIRDFVYGRRVGLVSPVSMLILLAFYYSVLSMLVPVYREPFSPTIVSQGNEVTDRLVNLLYGSLVLQYLVIALPMALSVRWIYRRQIKGRFNLVELVIAALYLSCTYLILCVFTTPLDVIDPVFDNLIVSVGIAVYVVKAINKAFPLDSRWKRMSRLGLCLLVGSLLTIIFLLLMVIPGVLHTIPAG